MAIDRLAAPADSNTESARAAASIDFRQLLEQLPAITYIVSAQDRASLYTSPQSDSIVGYSHEDLVANPALWLERVHPDDRAALTAAWDHTRATGEPLRCEYRIQTRAGNYIRLHDEATVVRDDHDRPLYVQGVMLEVTDRKDAETERDITHRDGTEQALRASERRARAIFDGAGIGAALADMSGRLLEANRAYQEMLGYSLEELRTMSIASVTHPEDAELDGKLFQEFIDGDLEHQSYEKRYVHKDGRVVWGHITRTVIRDADGNSEFCLGMVQNITERKFLEEQLRQSQKMEAVGRLAGGVAHDFNNLIAVIQSYARFLVEDMGPDDPRTEDAEEIVKAGERAATLVRQLLTFSRKRIANPEVVHLNEIVLDMEKLLRRTIGEDIDLRTRLAPSLWRVRVDQGGIEQILANLAVNARDAMQGGGALTIETLNVNVDDRFVRRHPGLEPGPYICLGFSDTGSGMPPEVIAHIFDPFFTTKARGQGTGLGLSTVYGIVEQVGGQVFVYSEPGMGTSFEVYLPAIDEAGAAGMNTKSEVDPVVQKILLAEDEHSVRGIIIRILGRNGYDVVGGTPEQAMEVAESGAAEVSLLLTDVVMPQISGVELMKVVRKSDSSVPILFMSGYSEDILDTHSVSEGAAFIAKPFTENELVGAVRTAIAART